MSFWDRTFYSNTPGRWLLAVAIFAAVWMILVIFKRIVPKRILISAPKSETKLDDMIVRLIGQMKPFFPLAAALYFASLSLTLPPALAKLIEKAAVVALLAQAGIWSTEILSFWLDRRRSRKEDNDAAATMTLAALSFVARILVWTTILLLALDSFGVRITTLLAGLGVGGVAVALAMQNVLGDLFASLSIILDKPFLIGDFIVIDDFRGRVEHIGLKTTRLRSLSGEQLIFGNGDLLKSRIRNFKRMQERRIAFSLGVIYQTSYDKLAAIPALIKEIIEAQPQARFERAHFKAYGESSLDFEIVYWIETPDYGFYMDIQQAINLALFRRFGEEGIDFAYPTRTIVMTRADD